jgi:hypothetical protein
MTNPGPRQGRRQRQHGRATRCLRALSFLFGGHRQTVQGFSGACAVPTRWNYTVGRALRPIPIRRDGILAMAEIDWTVVGSALLLVSWFGFLLLLLYFSPAIMP